MRFSMIQSFDFFFETTPAFKETRADGNWHNTPDELTLPLDMHGAFEFFGKSSNYGHNFLRLVKKMI